MFKLKYQFNAAHSFSLHYYTSNKKFHQNVTSFYLIFVYEHNYHRIAMAFPVLVDRRRLDHTVPTSVTLTVRRFVVFRFGRWNWLVLITI